MNRYHTFAVIACACFLFVGCKSTLVVTVDHYEGELTLSKEAQRARVMSLSNSAVQHLVTAFRAAEELQQDFLSQQNKAPKLKEKIRPLTDLKAHLWNTIRWAIAHGFAHRDPPLENQRREVLEQGLQFVEAGEPPSLKHRKRAGLNPAPNASQPVQVMQAMQVQQDPVPLSFQDFYGDLSRLVSADVFDDDPKQVVATVAFAIQFAERLRSLQREMEQIDENARRWIEVRFRNARKSAEKLTKIDEDGSESSISNLLKEVGLALGIVGNESVENLRDELEMKPVSGDLPAAYLERYYEDLYYGLWATLEEIYPRISGLGNFILKEEFNRSENSKAEGEGEACHRVEECQMKAAQAIVAKDLRAKVEKTIGAQAEGKDLRALLIGHHDLLQQLNRMKNPYIPVQSTGSYLAANEALRLIISQLRPGFEPFQDWQQITTVQVEAGADANYVIMRDHLGNWQVKAAKDDPSELINAVYGGVAAALDLAASGSSGASSRELRKIYRDYLASKANAAARPAPLAMEDLLATIRGSHEAKLGELDQRIAAESDPARKAEAQRERAALLKDHLATLSRMEEALLK